jgi:hypothetical protein
MKINVYATESFVTWLVREPVQIDTNDYSELDGLSDDEVKEYIRENAYDMRPTNEEWYENLGEQLENMDVRRDKIHSQESDIIFN